MRHAFPSHFSPAYECLHVSSMLTFRIKLNLLTILSLRYSVLYQVAVGSSSWKRAPTTSKRVPAQGQANACHGECHGEFRHLQTLLRPGTMASGMGMLVVLCLASAAARRELCENTELNDPRSDSKESEH